MARERRSVRRSAFTSDKLALCNDMTFLLFVGLIVNADDDGRESGRPESLKIKLASRNWSIGKIADMMTTLNTCDLINWYSCNCGIWYEVNGWDESQRGAWQGIGKVDSTITSYSEEHCARCGGPLETVDGSTKSRDKRNEMNGSKRERKPLSEYDADFEEWWSGYPRKVGKVKARILYDRLREEDIPAQLLLDARDAYIQELNEGNVEKRFIKHPPTFLGPDRHFEDYAAMRGWKK